MKRCISVIALAALMLATLAPTTKAASTTLEGRPFELVNTHPRVVEKVRKERKAVHLPFPNSANRGRKFNPGGEIIPALDLVREQPVLVLFASFSNNPPGVDELHSLTDFDALLFSDTYDPPDYSTLGYTEYPTDRTLKNYYTEASYGQLEIMTYNMPSTSGWTNVGKPIEAYVKGDGVHDYGFGSYPNNAQGLVEDVVKAADEFVDFSKYAHNGVVPNLFVVQAGGGAEWSLDPDLIWSHTWSLDDNTPLANGLTVDGVTVNTYAMMAAVGGDITGYLFPKDPPFPPTVGPFAHEYGHVLGLPDEYDYGFDSLGTGVFSIMGYGTWNQYPADVIFSGNTPAHFSAWGKYRLGFVTPTEITRAKTLELPPVEHDPVIYKMVVPFSDGKEYFLLENRQPIGFDEGLQLYNAHGLAIWHIDDTVLTRNYWRPNEAQNWKENRFARAPREPTTGEEHYGISIIQADDLWQLERNLSLGNAGDLYPGSTGATRFGSRTRPNSTSYYFWAGARPPFGYSGVTVDKITEQNGIVRAIVSFQK